MLSQAQRRVHKLVHSIRPPSALSTPSQFCSFATTTTGAPSRSAGVVYTTVRLPVPVAQQQRPSDALPLPPIRDDAKLTVVVDLDETLVHAIEADADIFHHETSEDALEEPFIPPRVPDLSIDFATMYGHKQKQGAGGGGAGRADPAQIRSSSSVMHVWMRPHAKQFLDVVSSFAEIVLWTAGTAGYANPVIDYLLDSAAQQQQQQRDNDDIGDKKKRCITYRLFRDTVTPTDGKSVLSGYYYKDLGLLGRDLKKTVIVENTFKCYSPHHLYNGIPVFSYYGHDMVKVLKDEHDTQPTRMVDPTLAELAGFLKLLNDVDDVRPVLKEVWKGRPIPGMNP
ncbi:mitochondrial NIF domain-containing protein [Andalucia godoyi]|uniref:Mitochondrial import inner membrane translocase subunit TIM50 n=1 Tax=Andalucia godoyi TaxID=505711 RepID=A0A8K0AHD9_ANDGO|nr:mitochondrial NIF domain-containing protein [Andalucia godoyi]|eukprot:ANDGO_04024.mRNA.1 mitochondrial NIF domain-containing protein